MAPIFRSVLGVILGFVAGFIVIGIVEMMSHHVYPLPPGVDPNDMIAMKEAVSKLPLGAFVFVLAAWSLGTFTGAAVACLIAGRKSMVQPIVIGIVFLLAGVGQLLLIPHPVWFMVVGLCLFLPSAYLGGKLALMRPLEKRADGEPLAD